MGGSHPLYVEETETQTFGNSLRVGRGPKQTLTLLLPTGIPFNLSKRPRVGLQPTGPTLWSKWRDEQKREPGAGENPLPCFPVLHSLTSPEPPVETSPKATPELSSTSSSRSPGSPPRNSSSGSPGPPPGNSSNRPCRPEILQSPAAGGLELLCQALCDPGVAVGWTQAPGGLEAYQRREAGAQAWLSVPWAGCCSEGWFQCRLDPGGQMASLYLVPEICEFWGLGRGLGELQREGSPGSRPQRGNGPAQIQCPQLTRGLPLRWKVTVTWHCEGCKFQRLRFTVICKP